MNWWKKMFKESVGDSEVRKPEYSDDEAKARYGDVKVIDYADSIYDDDPNAPKDGEVVEADTKTLKKIKPLDLMKVKFEVAANQSKRKDVVRGITLHHIMMGGFRKNVDFLTSKASGVSAHYVLGRNAELVQTVNSSKKAWHAGTSKCYIDGKVRTNLNNCMIGIEIVNPGYVEKEDNGKFYYNCGGKITEWKGDEPQMATIVYPSGEALSGYCIPYLQNQLNKLVALCKALVEKYPQITKENIVTHYQIATPIGRKNDPFSLDLDYIRKMVFENE